MTNKNNNLLEILNYIDVAQLNYEEWCSVGMALKYEGYSVSVYDQWSKQDNDRYNAHEIQSKWDSFNGSGTTGGTIVHLAQEQGYSFNRESRALDWDDIIGSKDDGLVIDKTWVESKEVVTPNDKWQPVQDLIKYIETLFEANENVAYVTESWEKDGKYLPKSKGAYDRTAGQLIEELNKCKGDIGAVIGDYNPQCGAWIRFNPVDGKGIKNENVTAFSYALVESDNEEIDKQNALIRELELPVACLVHSGNKSIHAIVKVDATTYDEYRKRVDFLYSVLKKNGIDIDTQNKNPSRLSRMPGVMRGENKQYLIDTNIGKSSWNEWVEWIEGVNDDLPEPENMEQYWNNMPDLAPTLIEGVLRQGHKMLIAGPSKAGKSFSLIELCSSIAEGKKWCSWQCTKGKVMYVNLELDRVSCLHRFKDVYTALGWKPDNIKNIDIWNLRGKSVPMDKLAPKLIRRAIKKQYIAIVIDPIYKVITGDENSADQMAHFCNQFDRVCTELGCAVIYCHHHSKGSQGGKKAIDRSSGSGVFARDPDAVMDLIELELKEPLVKQQMNNSVAIACDKFLESHLFDYDGKVSQDDICSERKMLEICKTELNDTQHKDLMSELEVVRKSVATRTAWRIEGTLREFPKFEPVNMWFDYPVHTIDDVGVLSDLGAEGENPSNSKSGGNSKFDKFNSHRKTKEQKSDERKTTLENAFQSCSQNGEITIIELEEYLGKTKNSVKNYIKEHGGFSFENGIIKKIIDKIDD